MGMFREDGSQEADIVKEMAESLGSAGIRVEEWLEKAQSAHGIVMKLLSDFHSDNVKIRPEISVVNDSIRNYNQAIDKAEDALRWLLIQREACGFRRHKNVHEFYPIPARMRLLKT